MTATPDKPTVALPQSLTGQEHLIDWQALKLLNQYRLFLISAIAAIYYLSDSQQMLGHRDAMVFQLAHTAYAMFMVLFAYLIGTGKPAVDTQFYLHNYTDVVFIGLLIYASGGVQSGLGLLLLIAIALLSQLTSVRYALLFAAIATSVILAEELFARLHFGAWAADFEYTAVLGSLLFATAWLMTVPLRRLLLRHRPESLRLRSTLDVQAIATLNEEIIRELDSGVVVIDSANQVQLINDTARTLLGAEFVKLPLHVGRLSDRLFLGMQDSKRSAALGSRAFTAEASDIAILPNFIPLSSGGMLVKLDDQTQIKRQFQQLKLASLGRLSASIAHEIRNPLSAIVHAVQLLQESDRIAGHDLELLQIAQRHAQRINRIIEDVRELANQQTHDAGPIDIGEHLKRFSGRFRAEHALPSDRLVCHVCTGLLARFDPEHFDRVLWNLCTNSQLHNEADDTRIELSCWRTRTGVAIVDVIDDGRGIDDTDREKLFEPFYSTHHAGTGLGLYIIRELCELNNASIECLEHDGGAHFRLSMIAASRMAA